jgi:hypothetical protein
MAAGDEGLDEGTESGLGMSGLTRDHGPLASL